MKRVLFLLVLFSTLSGALAQLKISQFPAITSASSPDEIPIVHGGVTNSITFSHLQSSLSLSWSQITGTPSTLAGYGITNGVANTVTVNGHALSSNVTVTPSDLGLVIGTNVQAFSANLGALAAGNPFTAGSGMTITGTWPNLTFTSSGGGGGSGTVTSVALALPTSLFVSPVSGSGGTTAVSLAPAFATQTANKIFASPNGSTGVPTFRPAVAADLGVGSITEQFATVLDAIVANSGPLDLSGTTLSIPGTITWGATTVSAGSSGIVLTSGGGNGHQLTGITQSQVAGLTITDVPQFSNLRITHSTLTYGASTAIDFSGDGLQTVSLTGNITFTSANLAAGRSKTVRIVADSSTRTLTFPGWTFVGAAAPASITASKTAILTVTSFGTTDGAVVAAYAAQP